MFVARMVRNLANEVLLFRQQNGLDIDEENMNVWQAQLGAYMFPIPNFRWRREIVALHDAHHLITGFDTSVLGELHVAAWETGVSCYSDPRARILCVGLMVGGLLASPSQTVLAFKSGRKMREAYSRLSGNRLLNLTLSAARKVLATDGIVTPAR